MILDRLLNREQRAISYQDVWGAGDPWEGGASTHAGVNVSPAKALEQRAVYACVSLISESIASLPFHVFRPEGEARLPLPNEPRWLDSFNGDCESSDGMAQVITSLLLDGNSYNITPRDKFGEVVEIWPQDPRIANPTRDSKGNPIVEIVDGARNIAYRAGRFGEINHIRALRWPGQLKGISPIQAAKQAVGLGLAAEEFGALFFGQGAHASGVLETAADVDAAAAQKIAQMWKKTHGGLKKSHLPAVLGGGLKWTQTTVANKDSQFTELREFQVVEVAGFYRVPPHLVGAVNKSTSWGTGIEQQSIGFVTLTLTPWIVRVEQAFRRLSRSTDPRADNRFNVSGLLRGDIKARYEAYAQGRQWGFLSADDVRALEDLSPLPDGQGQTYLSPLNMVPAEGDTE